MEPLHEIMKKCQEATLKFQEATSCSLCAESYDVLTHLPKVLTCGHTFCLTCLTSIQQRRTPTPRSCPSCRVELHIPAEGPSALPTNHCIRTIIEDVKVEPRQQLQRVTDEALVLTKAMEEKKRQEHLNITFVERMDVGNKRGKTVLGQLENFNNYQCGNRYSQFAPTEMRISHNNTVVLSFNGNSMPPAARWNFSLEIIPVVVQKFEGSICLSNEITLPNTWYTCYSDKLPTQDVVYDTSVVSLSPDGQYLALTTQVLKGNMAYAPFSTLPSPCAALTNQRAWTYEWQAESEQEESDFRCVMRAYSLEENPQPLESFSTPFLFQGDKEKQEHSWLHSIQACCNPVTGDLALVHGRTLLLSKPKGDMTTVQLGYSPLRPTWQCVRSVVAMTSSAKHIFIADATNNLHAHSWSTGKETKAFSASKLKIQGLNASASESIIGIGYSDEFDEPLLRILVGNHPVSRSEPPSICQYLIFKVNEE